MKEKKYEIGDKVYFQRPLVLGQIEQLTEFLKDLGIQSIFFLDDLEKALTIDYDAIAILCGDKLPRGIAIVLTEDGVPLKDKDLSRLSEVVKYSFDADQTMQVIEDFFTCNPISLLFKRYLGMMQNLKVSMMQDGSPESVSSSPEGISQSMAAFSGDTLQ